MDKKLWLIEADELTVFGDIVQYRARFYAADAGAAWLMFTRSFKAETSWQYISVREVKQSEART